MINLKEFFNDDAQIIGLSSLGLSRKVLNNPPPTTKNQAKHTARTTELGAIKFNAPPTQNLFSNSKNININFNNQLIG